MEKVGLVNRPERNELLLAIKTLSMFLEIPFLPKNLSVEDFLRNPASFAKQYPERFKVFKEYIQKFVKLSKTPTKDKIRDWRDQILIPKGFISASKYLNVSADRDLTYGRMQSFLRVMMSEEKFANCFVDLNEGGRVGRFYYSKRMLDEAYERAFGKKH